MSTESEPIKNRKMQKNSFYSHGKLLMTGEYLVLNGAYALALPLQVGQNLLVNTGDKPGCLCWETKIRSKPWLNAVFDIKEFDILESNIAAPAGFVADVLKAARTLNRAFLADDKPYTATANLEFDTNYGFGSSSSFISNIARWAQVDVFELHRMVSNGSGYDVAAARSEKAIIFQRAGTEVSVNPVNFRPPFFDRLFFGYLGKKLNTEKAVAEWRRQGEPDKRAIEKINGITLSIVGTRNINVFLDLLAEHEQIMSGLLRLEPVKSALFPDFRGEVKSLGAWGGDFALFASREPGPYVLDYLQSKSIAPAYYYDEIIL